MPDKTRLVDVREDAYGKWAIFVNGTLIEGGFYTRDAAMKASVAYILTRKAES